MSFIPTENTPYYEARIDGHVCSAPEMATPDPSRTTVYPFKHSSGYHVLRMQPLGPEHQQLNSTLLHDCATFLEHHVSRVEGAIFSFPTSNNHHFCFLVMMTWYFVDDETGLVSFFDRCMPARLWLVDHEIWAAVVTFRNLHVLRDHMSDDAVRRYMGCFNRLVSVLRDHGCIVHSSYTPIH
jgi:hypothetical protein